MENMYEKMQQLKPGNNPIFTAVDRLTNPDEMNAFVRDCVEDYRKNGETEHIRNNAESLVKENIGYIVGYYDKPTAERWMNTIQGASHPVYGKNIPFIKNKMDNYINSN